MIRGLRFLFCLSGALVMAVGAPAEPLHAFDYPDTQSAREDWEPQFGSLPVRVETLDDGTTCLALEAQFEGAGDRACWDWVAPLDLSSGGYIAFEATMTNGGVVGNTGIYFGTPGGWYSHFWWGGMPDSWTERTIRLDSFGTEGTPGGWDQVTRFRFSVWSTGAGSATFRLRNLRLVDAAPEENYLRNGSFEFPGVGVPYGWGSGHWGIGWMPWAANMDLWRERYSVDHAVARHGEKSLRIINTDDMRMIRAVSVWVTPPASAETLVLSAWLRADREGLPVTLNCGGRNAQVSVGTEWTQASLPGIPRQGSMSVGIAPGGPGTLWIDAVQLQGLDAPSEEFHPALRDESVHLREAQVDWTPPRRTADVAAGRSTAGPVEAATARIDEHGRFLLGEQPYLQHSLGLEFIDDLDILNFAAASGFREVCVQVRETISTDRLADIFDRCGEIGLRIIPWLDGRMTREQFAEHIRTLRDHPALLCWYVYDEPSGDRFAEADARYRLARELDPDHPALINYLGSKLTDHTGDIYSTDVYPIPHSTPTAAIGAVRQMQRAARPEGKPVWMWLQGTGHAYWMDREPSPRELSCMVYGSLIEGAAGVYYFAQIPYTRECFDEMRALLVEVDALAPAIMSVEPAPAATCSDPNILLRAAVSGGATWLLAVNTLPDTVETEIGIAGAQGPVDVVFEDRQVDAEDGVWTDTFGAYERHVYRIGADG